MLRRSFLSLLGAAPVALPAIIRTAVARAPQSVGLVEVLAFEPTATGCMASSVAVNSDALLKYGADPLSVYTYKLSEISALQRVLQFAPGQDGMCSSWDLGATPTCDDRFIDDVGSGP